MPRNPDTPGVIVFPPVLFAITMMVGVAFHFLLPLHVFPTWPARVVGVLVLVAGTLLVRWGRNTMVRMGTSVRPDQPSTALVLEGPFRFTRNPLYLGTTGMYLGVALLIDDLWPLILVLPMLAVLEWGVIRREERYLEMKFGEAYRAYQAKVRQWF